MNYFFQIESSRELKEFKEDLIKRLLGLLQLMSSDVNKNQSLDQVISMLKHEIIGLKSQNNILFKERQNLERLHKNDQEKIKDLEQIIEGLRLANSEYFFQITIMQENINGLENDLRMKFEKQLIVIINEYQKFREEIASKDKQVNNVIINHD